MASNQVTLVLLCGEIWRSLATEAPLNSSVLETTASATTGSPSKDKGPIYEPRATTPSSSTPEIFDIPSETPAGTWLTAILIGTILTGMVVGILLILLWKYCQRPRPVDTNWAGRSPFADGDMPEAFAELEQTNKRASILSMLPWKLRQDASPAGAPDSLPGGGPEGCGPRAGAGGAVGASAALEAGAAVPPAQEPCALPPAAAECPELPPPPAWLQEPAAGGGPGLDGLPPWEPQAPLPPAPDLAAQDVQELLPPEPPL
ncbi:EVI2B protein, partial [Crypturellus undulatus]|nr:EVI2B protein [Crypturellus undulatus]